MGILKGLQIYKGKYTLTGTVKFDAEDLALISSATVVESTKFDGKLALALKDSVGNQRFLPVSEQSALEVGDTPNPEDIIILILSRPGDNDIYRVDVESPEVTE